MSSWAASLRSSASDATAENAGGAGRAKAAAGAQAGKRVALGNLTNVVGGGGRLGAADAKLGSTKSIVDVKKGGSFASLRNVNTGRGSISEPASDKSDWALSQHDSALQGKNVSRPSVPNIVTTGGSSPGLSEDSVSMEDAMSTCNSIESSDLECLDDGDSSIAASLHCWANDKLCISDSKDVAAFNWRKHSPIPMKTDNIFDLDNNHEDPQLCATLAYEIYKNLRDAETRKRPSTNFVETTQTDMSTNMRAMLIDWLVEVTEEYRLVPETLYLTVNYIDRYLSVKEISRHRLQLLGVACLLIAAKYEEICPPQVEELCYLTDDSYTKDEVLQMEASVLNHLKFEMTAPTEKCFLRRFVCAAQLCDEGSTLHLEYIANYICELSLLEYSLLCYAPSLVAASSVFLAKFVLKPTKNPWNSTLSYYTQYTPSELHGCVRVLHRLFCVGPGSHLPAIREKYSQHKYKFVAKKYCPPSIPIEFFQDATS
ncbi:cyclin-A1-4-like isoform X2 [Phragmites australis]|uniref:cyclin-A1-4-like isoform X2 n=1 Tax=Phragmites australis TaxID=29695 RepID=UPI002D7841AF|nr:cyclin-A1-4-like isoform X2 [Phragmites australis]